MKQFEVKILNKQMLLLIVVPVIIAYILSALIYVLDRYSGEDSLIKAFLISLIPLFIIVFFLNKICRHNYTIGLDESEITLKRRGRIYKSIFYKDIMFIRQFSENELFSLVVFSKGHIEPDIELLQINNSQGEEILSHLLSFATYIYSTQVRKDGIVYHEYVNKSMVNSDATTILTIKTSKKATTKLALIVFFMILLILSSIMYLFIENESSDAYYKFNPDGVYYNDVKIDVNPKEVEQLSFTVIKDSSHVYYKGKILEWADHKTFKNLHPFYYYDKNGIYYETSRVSSENEILPYKGDFDFNTLKYMGGIYFKDKYNLFKLKTDLTSMDEEPLVKIGSSGVDLQSLVLVSEISKYWFKDKNTVYISTGINLKPSIDLDPETFEVLTSVVSRDKNHVYYMTRYNDYKIMEGVDPQNIEIEGDNIVSRK